VPVPTYDYRCNACGEGFEIVCPFAEREDKAVCPACGARDAVQVFGPIARPAPDKPFSPGHFERPPGRTSKPHWVEPKG